MPRIIPEGKAKIYAYPGKISKDLPVFYNPLMKTNRDSSLLVLKALKKKNLKIALPLAGTGIRGIRFFKELPKSIIKEIHFNDLSKRAVTDIKKNLKLNQIKGKFKIKNQEANLFFVQSEGFDYIDIDPFGSPNLFLGNALFRLSREGILAVTATDTAALTGTYPAVCHRKYWAQPLKNELMHELGLRILIRKIQLLGAQFDKALLPLLSYAKDHYYRIFFINHKGKELCDELLKQHLYFLYCPKCLHRETSKSNQKTCCCTEMLVAGPLWTGPLQDQDFFQKVKTTDPFFQTLKEESKINTVGFYDLHQIASAYKRTISSTQETIQKLKKKCLVAPTHFSFIGFKRPLM